MNFDDYSIFHDNSAHGDDRYLVRELDRGIFLDAVMDGATMNYGNVASQKTLDSLQNTKINSLDSLIETIKEVNDELSMSTLRPATTLSVGLYLDYRLHFVSLGDSPAYILRNGILGQINQLDKYLENSSIITNYVGREKGDLKFFYKKIPLFKGDTLFYMSDGISDNNCFISKYSDMLYATIYKDSLSYFSNSDAQSNFNLDKNSIYEISENLNEYFNSDFTAKKNSACKGFGFEPLKTQNEDTYDDDDETTPETTQIIEDINLNYELTNLMKLKLDWNDNSASSYEIYKNSVLIDEVSESSYTDSQIDFDMQYSYHVTPVFNNEAYSNSNVINFDTYDFHIPPALKSEDIIYPLEDTFININSNNYNSFETLHTYTWPENSIANLILLRFRIPENIDDAQLYLYQFDFGGDSSYKVSVHAIYSIDPDFSQANRFYYDENNRWSKFAQLQNEVPLAQKDISEEKVEKTLHNEIGFVSINITPLLDYRIGEEIIIAINSDPIASADSFRYFASKDSENKNLLPRLVTGYNMKKDVLENVSDSEINENREIQNQTINENESVDIDISINQTQQQNQSPIVNNSGSENTSKNDKSDFNATDNTQNSAADHDSFTIKSTSSSSSGSKQKKSSLSSIFKSDECIPNFEYSKWSECMQETQSRMVHDLNRCDETRKESRKCVEGGTEEENLLLNAQKLKLKELSPKVFSASNIENKQTIYLNKKANTDKFILNDEQTGLSYYVKYMSEENGKYFYSVQRIDEKLIPTLEKEGLIEMDDSSSTKLTNNFLSSKSSIVPLTTLYTFILLLIVFVLKFVVDKKRRKESYKDILDGKSKKRLQELYSAKEIEKNKKYLYELETYIRKNSHVKKETLRKRLEAVGWNKDILDVYFFIKGTKNYIKEENEKK